GGGTIAVLGSGLNHIYPHRHRQLAESIVASGGTLVSEFSLAATPVAYHFPRRNRIISGLSYGVLVVEAALRSGSLVTARCALEQGREVFAIPGPLGHPGMEGPHWLIKQGAAVVTEPEDILAQFPSLNRQLPEKSEMTNYCADQESVALPFPELLANVGDEATPVDVVAERAGQPVPVTVAQLLELELAGWIAAVPGGYVRLRRAGHVRRTNVFV
ncbi:MAG: DNA-processing protein DprA, partial [Kluyvera intermedia]